MNINVSCAICGQTMKELTNHIFRKHNIKSPKYKMLYPNSPIRSEYLLNQQSTRMLGDRNPAYQHAGRLSPFSNKFFKGTDNIAAIKLKAQTNRQLNHGYTTTLEYWLKKTDGDIIKANELLSNRQATFSLDKCVNKYGVEKGREVWFNRQKKWQNTLNSKSTEEKMRINRLKVGSSYLISNAEREIIKLLNKQNIYPISQYCISDEIGYVYDICLDKKLIEYNGDYWHCNPKIYDADFFNKSINMQAKNKWAKDRAKLDYAISAGYDILTIWEHDYKQNPNRVIAECLAFLIQ